MHSPYWIDCQVAPPCMVWTLRTMSLTSDPGSYQINCCPYVSITWLLTNRRRVTSVALSPLNWTDVFVVCACLLRWERVNGLLNMVPEPGRHGELWEVGEDGETLAALPVVGFGPVLGCAYVWTGGWACHWCCRFRRHVLPWGSLGWKRVAVLGCGEDHHRSVNAYWSARGFPIMLRRPLTRSQRRRQAQTTNTSVQFNGDRATDVTRLLLVKSHVIDTYGQQLIW